MPKYPKNRTFAGMNAFSSGGSVAPPAQPTGLSATPASTSQIDLAWTDAADNETAYKVYRSTDDATYAQVGDDLAADANSYSDTTPDDGVNYYYKVAAVNSGGETLSDAVLTNTLLLTLVSYWKMDETEGNAIDIIGTNTLTDVNTVFYGTGKIGNCRSLRVAQDEAFAIADNATLRTGDINFTLAGWFNLANVDANRALAGKWETTGKLEWLLEYPNVEKQFSFYMLNGAGTTKFARFTAVTPQINTWYFIACWHDAAADRVYIQVNDGAPESGDTAGGGPAGTTGEFAFGRAYSRKYDGLVDEIGWWKRTLTTDERAALYNGGNAFRPPFDQGGEPEPLAADVPAATSALTSAITWLKRAQDANPATGGVSVSYSIADGWSSTEYKEVSGYIIPTFYDAAVVLSDADLTTRAAAIAAWEHGVQAETGLWDFVFDTGQVMLGMLRAYDETANADYLADAVEAGDWLVANQEVDGSWLTSSYTGIVHAYHTRVAWALLVLWQATGTAGYRTAAIANLDWAVSQQAANGWFANAGITSSQNANPLTHTLSYTAEGLLESGIILNDDTYINAARALANAYIAIQEEDGSLGGGMFTNTWAAYTIDECLTGSAQASHVFWVLYHRLGEVQYRNAGVTMNQYLRSVQAVSENDDINGGIYGSYPYDAPNGGYRPNDIPSWAAKFFADAMMYEIAYGA